MIHLSFDQDWAPAWATLDLHRLLSEANVAGTLFVTHDCPSLDQLRSTNQVGLIELGWHPNFEPRSSQGTTRAEVLDQLAHWVPNAVGVRGHCLVRSTALWLEYGSRGLLYDSSDLMDGMIGLRPLRAWNGLTRLPIFWEDDVCVAQGCRFDIEELDLSSDGLKVFDFHPVHVALNTSNGSAYAALKAHLAHAGRALCDATRDDFAPFVRTDASGACTMLVQLLDYLRRHRDQAGGSLRTLVEP